MRSRLAVASCVVLAALGCASDPDRPGERHERPRLEITLSGPASHVRAGDPVPVRIVVANAGKVLAEYAEDGADRELRAIHVVTPDDRDRTYAGPRTDNVATYLRRLGPGESCVVTSGFDLAKAFDLSRPGTYKATIRGVRLEPDLEPVDSNEVAITIDAR